MGLKVNFNMQTLLFTKLFGDDHPVTQAVVMLINTLGAKVTSDLYTVTIVVGEKAHTQALTVGTTALVKGTVSEVQKNQNKFMLKAFVEKLTGLTLDGIQVGVDLAPSPDQTVVDAPAKQLKPYFKSLEQAAATIHDMDIPPDVPVKAVKVPPANKIKQPTTQAILKLIEATELGQRVKGTSVGSIYRVVALNNRVKIATNIKGSAISMRVECKSPTKDEQKSVEELFSWKGSYGSKHMDAGSLPPSRVVGALLFSLGVKFDQVVQGREDLEACNG